MIASSVPELLDNLLEIMIGGIAVCVASVICVCAAVEVRRRKPTRGSNR